MSDLTRHQTEAVQLIFLWICKSGIILVSGHSYMDDIVDNKYRVIHVIQVMLHSNK